MIDKIYSWVSRSENKSYFAFEPQTDITTYELAQCINYIFCIEEYVRDVESYIKRMPPEISRHFKVYEDVSRLDY